MTIYNIQFKSSIIGRSFTPAECIKVCAHICDHIMQSFISSRNKDSMKKKQLQCRNGLVKAYLKQLKCVNLIATINRETRPIFPRRLIVEGQRLKSKLPVLRIISLSEFKFDNAHALELVEVMRQAVNIAAGTVYAHLLTNRDFHYVDRVKKMLIKLINEVKKIIKTMHSKPKEIILLEDVYIKFQIIDGINAIRYNTNGNCICGKTEVCNITR